MAVSHGHPRIIKAIQEQVTKLPFCHSGAYTSDVSELVCSVESFDL